MPQSVAFFWKMVRTAVRSVFILTTGTWFPRVPLEMIPASDAETGLTKVVRRRLQPVVQLN